MQGRHGNIQPCNGQKGLKGVRTCTVRSRAQHL